jgi:endonuclease YncB( thermonuclease family)
VLKKAAVSASTDKRTAEWIQAVINSIEQDSADEDKSSKERTDREKSSFEKSSLEYIFRNYKLSFGIAADIYDGDTVKLEDGTVIRYLGVDTPEIIHGERGYNESGGQDAYHENRVIVSGKRLIIAEPKRSKHDSYGRLLAYIYAPVFKEGDYCLNVSRHLVEEGYGEEVYGNYDRNLPLKIGYLKLKEFVKGE